MRAQSCCWLLLVPLLALAAADATPPLATDSEAGAVAPARNLAWQAPTDETDGGPVIGLAHDAEHYREHLRPLHDPPEAAPPVEQLPFASHDLLLLTWGVKPTGGYALAATTVLAGADSATVTVRCEAPAPDAMVTMALTHPAVLVAVPKREQLLIRLTGDRPPAGVSDFAATTGGRFTVIDDRAQQ